MFGFDQDLVKIILLPLDIAYPKLDRNLNKIHGVPSIT
jgi:hypothetical protein